MNNEEYLDIKEGLSVGTMKIANKYEIFTEEEIDNINNKIPELDERVDVIEDEIEEINSSLDNKANKSELDNANINIQNITINKADKSMLNDALETNTNVWSALKVKEMIKAIPKGDKGESGTASLSINDNTINTTQTWSSSKINSKMGKSSVIFYSGNEYALKDVYADNFLTQIDSKNMTMTFPIPRQTDGGFIIDGIYHKFIESNTKKVIDLAKTISTSLGKIIFLLDSKEIVIRDYNNNNDENTVTIGVIRYFGTNLGSINLVFPFYLDGCLYGERREATIIGENPYFILPMTGEKPNIDSNQKTLTFFDGTILVWRNRFIILPETEIDLGSVLSSAKKIYYNTSNNTFKVLAYTQEASVSEDILVATIRMSSKITASISCPYTVDGILFGEVENGIVKNSANAIIKSINHRGYLDAPENTLPAFELSKKMGYSYVECDVRVTKDNEFVLLHDPSIDRTSNSTGEVSSLTLSQLKELDFGSWKNEKYVGTKIPTLKEFLLLCKKLNLRAYLEIKFTLNDVSVTALKKIINRCGMANYVTFVGGGEKIVEHFPNCRMGIATSQFNKSDVDIWKKEFKTETNTIFIQAQREYLTEELCEYCLDNDLEVEVWNVFTDEQVLEVAQMGIVGITNDNLNIAEILEK